MNEVHWSNIRSIYKTDFVLKLLKSKEGSNLQLSNMLSIRVTFEVSKLSNLIDIRDKHPLKVLAKFRRSGVSKLLKSIAWIFSHLKNMEAKD